MSNRVDPNLLQELKGYGEKGAVNVEACFNCGNCTAICPLSDDDHAFPRDTIRLLQLGLKDRLRQSVDPWLCYYCGDCSRTCPRGAEPGEAQMALRRWLTGQYDWTGLARRFYTSATWEFGSIILVALLVVLGFVFFGGPMVTDQVALNTFAPVETIHLLDWTMAAFLLVFLLSNVYRMWKFTIGDTGNANIPLDVYAREAWRLPYQFFTQERFAQCEEKRNWRSHFLLVTGYVIMLVLVVFLLPWFQTDNIYPIWHPQRWLGYYATIVLLYGGSRIIWGRLQKARQMHRFSHPSDWIFPILLLVTTITGILVHLFRYLGWPLPTYYIYVVHLAVLVPMLVLEVPFGKWSHLAYRPLAIYFEAVREKAVAQEKADVVTPALAGD